MKILPGDLEPDSGTVGRPKKLGILRQNQFAYENVRVLDVVIQGNKPLWAAIQEKDKLLAHENITDEMGARLGELEGTVAEEDGYTAESDAGALLEGLGVPTVNHELPMNELQNAYKFRVLLAQALFGKPQALLLDEPTNNLDIDSIRWLEKFLHEYEGTLVVISHDRRFLNGICTHIADIDYESIITYPGDYDDMVIAKTQLCGRVESDNAEKKKKISQLQDFVARFHAGTRASQVQSRIKQIDKLKMEELKRSNIARPFIRFDQEAPQRQADADGGRALQGVRREDHLQELLDAHHARGEGRRPRSIGRRQDDAAQDARRAGARGQRQAHLGTRGSGGLPAAGP